MAADVEEWYAAVARTLDAGYLASTPIVAFDAATGVVVGATPAAVDLLGSTPVSVQDLSRSDRIAGQDLHRLFAAVAAWQEGAEGDGRERAWSLTGEVRLRTAGGWAPIGVTVALHRRPRLSGSLVVVTATQPAAGSDHGSDGGEFWCITDREARVVAIDPRAVVVWETPEELVGTLTAVLTHPEDLAVVLPMGHDLYNGLRDEAAYTVRVAASDGRWVPLHVELRRTVTADGSTLVVSSNRIVRGARRVILPGELTQRESEVVAALFDGLRVPQIAERQGVSTHTVRNQLRSVFRKLDVRGQADLTARCHRPNVEDPAPQTRRLRG